MDKNGFKSHFGRNGFVFFYSEMVKVGFLMFLFDFVHPT